MMMKNDIDAMEIGVGFDALNNSNKRVKRSSTGNDSVDSSAREDDFVEEIDASERDLGMRPWKPINGLRCKNGRAAKGNSSPSYSLEKGFSNVAQKREGNDIGKREVIISQDEGSSFPFQRSHMSIKGKEVESKDKNIKGKVNLEDHTLKDVQNGEPTNLSSRAALFGKEVVTIAEEHGPFGSYRNLSLPKNQDFKINMNQLSHTNSRNNKEKLSSSYLIESMHETDIEYKGNANVIDKCPRITMQGHISNPHHDQAFPDPVASKRNHSCKKHAKEKRKCNSISCNLGKTSVSILNQASHAEITNFKLDMSSENEFHCTALIEIEKHYPGARFCNFYGQQSGVSDNSSARASQIESDEIFARKLQEQFYHETTRVRNMDMVDETIARSLQQDENEYAATLPQNGRSTSELIDEIKWKLEYEPDLEKRLDLYEELEDLLENNDRASNHSFNSDIDESKHQHVDSSLINNLPLTKIQDNNDKEACAVCLEIPSIGETMRYLPCFHKFHKMCIDTWLKKKPACPVCKFSITSS